jgi:hypothetical protein
MDRSDGTKVPICVACGTIPIYNPRLNIAICPLCDGPVRYAGDNINNLEILPPLGRPKSRIVEVEMPYSTKLLTQEQETYLNLTMRYITTSGVSRLNPLEYSGKSSEVVKELPRLILPETVAPAYIEEIPKAVLSVEQLRSMGATINMMTEEERRVADTVFDESTEGELVVQNEQLTALSGLQNQQSQQLQETIQEGNQLEQTNSSMTGGLLPPALETSFSIPASQFAPQAIASQPRVSNEGVVNGPAVPGSGPIITVRTDPEAMMMDGISPPMMGQGAPRQIRRNHFGGMDGGMMMPQMRRYTPSMDGGIGGAGQQMSSPGGNIGAVRVNKLE